MTLDNLIALLEKEKAARGHGNDDVTVLQYNGGDDVPADIVGIHFCTESHTLSLATMYRR